MKPGFESGTDGPEGFIQKNLAIEASDDIGEETQNFIAQIVKPEGFERRINERSPVEIAVKVEILLPEQTFRPCGFDARTLDMSVRGMKILVENLPDSFYKRLHAKTRFTRIEFDDPRLGGVFRLIGKVMWFAYNSSVTADKEGDCMLGILFDTEDQASLEKYAAFARDLMARAGKRVP